MEVVRDGRRAAPFHGAHHTAPQPTEELVREGTEVLLAGRAQGASRRGRPGGEKQDPDAAAAEADLQVRRPPQGAPDRMQALTEQGLLRAGKGVEGKPREVNAALKIPGPPLRRRPRGDPKRGPSRGG